MKTYKTRKTGRACYDILNTAGGVLGAAFKEPGSAGYLGTVETATETYMTGGMTVSEAAAAVAELYNTIHRVAPELPAGVTIEVTATWHGRHATNYRILFRGLEIGTIAKNPLGGGLWIAEPPANSAAPEVMYHQRAAGRDAEHAARVFCVGWLERRPPAQLPPANPADYSQASMF